METALPDCYDAHEGRPSWPPAVLVRMLLLEQYADLSDREASEQTAYNLLYRAFVGVGLEERVPDDTTLVRFRSRLGGEGLRRVFELALDRWQAGGCWEPSGGRWTAVTGGRRWRGGVGCRCCAKGGRWWRRRWPIFRPNGWPSGYGCWRRCGPKGTGRLSFVDPDARWGHKSEEVRFCGSKTHQALDPDSRLLTAVEVLPGNADEAVRTDVLLAQEQERLAEEFIAIGDGLYNTTAPPWRRWRGLGGGPASVGCLPSASVMHSPTRRKQTGWSAKRVNTRSARHGWTKGI